MRGLGGFAAGVARGGGNYAGDFVKVRLHAPEAATCESGFGGDARRYRGRDGLERGLRPQRCAHHHRKTEQGSRTRRAKTAGNCKSCGVTQELWGQVLQSSKCIIARPDPILFALGTKCLIRRGFPGYVPR